MRKSERGDNSVDFVFFIFLYISANLKFVCLLDSDFKSLLNLIINLVSK